MNIPEGVEVADMGPGMEDPKVRAERIMFIIGGVDREVVRKLEEDWLGTLLRLEGTCRTVALGTAEPETLTVDDWEWAEKLFEEVQAKRHEMSDEERARLKARIEKMKF